MNIVRRLVVMAVLLAAVSMTTWAQENAKAGVTTAAGSKFATLPVFPACATVSAQRGDPSKGGAVLLSKMTRGCVIPWHWHTAAEGLMIVGGKAKMDMKDAAAAALASGDYVYLPGKHMHQFSCLGACTFFVVTEGAFDIHYIDKDGKEIPPEQALGPAKKPAAAKATPKTK